MKTKLKELSADAHLTTNDLAVRWRISPATLRNWRWNGRGPAALKLGGRVVYRLSDIQAFEAAHVQTSTTRGL